LVPGHCPQRCTTLANLRRRRSPPLRTLLLTAS
jgi:hypothetical protein